jgi:alginate O-acetyltransferase complex protein AlgI
VIGWVLFRADNLSHALSYLQALSGFNGAGSGQYYLEQYVDNEVVLTVIFGLIAAMPMATFMRRLTDSLVGSPGAWSRSLARGVSLLHLVALGFLFILSCSAVAVGTYSPFIYFKF